MSKSGFKIFGAQVLLFLTAGAFSCAVDFALFIALKKSGLSANLSFILAFSGATLFNYFICLRFIFTPKGNQIGQIIKLFIVALIGLILSTLMFSLLNHHTKLTPLICKTLVIPVTLCWNFWGRRRLVFNAALPERMLLRLQRIVKSDEVI